MITNVTTTSGATGTAAAENAMKKSTGMNKDDFLKLFVTQLQNQDPLNPQDGTQFISQLAQLTQVEQAYNSNTNLQSLLNQGQNGMAMASFNLIGKQVEAQGSEINLEAGSPAAINFSLEQAVKDVTVVVKDASGATVKTIAAGATGAGKGSVSWDGTNTAGSKVPAGAYSFSVSAHDANGSSVASTSFIRGRVDGVDMSGAAPILSIGSVRLNLSDITSVSAGA